MGREALIHAEIGSEAGEVRALLESTEMILRGEIGRRYPKEAMTEVTVVGGVLHFRFADESVRLHLGGKMAQSWAAAIAKPPPSLRVKLGLDKGSLAMLIGEITDAALAEATAGSLVAHGAEAQMMIAVIDNPGTLAEARRIHGCFPTLPLWTVYPKGSGVSFGDTAIRALLREAGFRDTKSCAVSDQFTATRYNPT
ncbi:hypothetical protein SAMN05880582_10534 [Rhizobium sp. RU20A]|nr:hypothetical protein SAMN05880582_10534 [Rhizobium sp. RU20A]